MAASFNITLPGVGDQIIATVTETLKHYELDAKVPSASSIGEEVGKNVAAVLEATLSEFKKPVASSLREQILANADAILNLYIGDIKCIITGCMLTITGTGEQTEAAVIAKGDNPCVIHSRLRSLVIIQGPQKGSDIEALLALHEKTKLVLARARSQADINARKYNGVYAFYDLAKVISSD